MRKWTSSFLNVLLNLDSSTLKKRLIYIISEGNQLDLETMEMIAVEDCLLVEDKGIGSVDIAIRYSLSQAQA